MRNSTSEGSKVGRLALATMRLWQGLSYDDAITVATEARRLLGLERPQKRRRVIARLSRPELEQLLEHAYRASGLEGLMMKTLVLTGARVSEFVALDVADFGYDDKEIVIRKGKGKKERVVPITPALADELRVFVGYRTHGPLFQPRAMKPRPFSRRRVQQILKALAAGAGISKRVYPHLMRHTIAQHLLEGGMPLDQVQKFLGHERISTTQIYAESTSAMIRDGYRRALSGRREISEPMEAPTGRVAEVQAALVSLGFRKAEIKAVLPTLDPAQPTGELVRRALVALRVPGSAKRGGET